MTHGQHRDEELIRQVLEIVKTSAVLMISDPSGEDLARCADDLEHGVALMETLESSTNSVQHAQSGTFATIQPSLSRTKNVHSEQFRELQFVLGLSADRNGALFDAVTVLVADRGGALGDVLAGKFDCEVVQRVVTAALNLTEVAWRRHADHLRASPPNWI